MKKLILSLFITVGLYSSHAQYDYMDALVIDSAWNSMSGYNVWITVYLGGNPVISKHGVTDQWGSYRDSISSSQSRDSIKFIAYDCNGELIKGSWGTQAPPWPGYYSDTLYADPNCLMATPSCQTGFTARQSSITPLTIDFTDSTQGSGIKSAKAYVNMYFFGDNDSVYGIYNPSHTYAQPGKYEVMRTYWERDTVYNHLLCHSIWKDSVEVLAQVPAPPCKASYYVDTVNSGYGKAIIYNNSTPAFNDPNFTTSYLWDFGDGDTSHQPFPTHTYANAGSYAVCLTITATGAGSPCTSTFCDTLGIDSTGALIYKNTQSSFVLEVRNPGPIGLEENSLTAFAIYPNPAGDVVFVKPSYRIEENLHYSLYDLKGTSLKTGEWLNTKSAEPMQIDLSDLPVGIYLLKLNNHRASASFRIIRQ